MNSKRRWYELLLPVMAILLVILAGMVRTANAYDYDQSAWEEYEDDDDHTTPAQGSSWKVFGDATANTFTYGTYVCECMAVAYSKANDDRADA